MHLGDISEICEKTSTPSQPCRVCQLHLLMSNLGGRPWPALPEGGRRLTDTEETDREADPERGTCRYANAVAAIRRHSDTTLPAWPSALRGQPADFSHFHRQPSFSTLVETGHCHLLLGFWAAEPISVWEIECGAFRYEQDYNGLWWASESHLKMGC